MLSREFNIANEVLLLCILCFLSKVTHSASIPVESWMFSFWWRYFGLFNPVSWGKLVKEHHRWTARPSDALGSSQTQICLQACVVPRAAGLRTDRQRENRRFYRTWATLVSIVCSACEVKVKSELSLRHLFLRYRDICEISDTEEISDADET